MKKVSVAGLLIFMSAPLFAKDELKNIPHAELVANCIEVIDDGGDASLFAAELLSRERFHLGTENAAKGAQCLETVYGAPFVFAGWRFVSPELEARAKKEAQELRTAEQQKSSELAREVRAKEVAYVAAVAEACEREYTKDRFRALTTPICGEIFRVRGLP
tara:strand:- start:222 stop:704 length:483 start_codon:yes stop_codon:yes gene_type:complete